MPLLPVGTDEVFLHEGGAWAPYDIGWSFTAEE